MFLSVLLLTGCGLFVNANGDWEGVCTVPGYDPFDLELELEETGGDVEGDVKLTTGGYAVRGDAAGDRDGVDVDLDIELTNTDGQVLQGRFKGEIDGDEMEGDLTFSSAEGAADCELER